VQLDLAGRVDLFRLIAQRGSRRQARLAVLDVAQGLSDLLQVGAGQEDYLLDLDADPYPCPLRAQDAGPVNRILSLGKTSANA
jgi:hypothetical protein